MTEPEIPIPAVPAPAAAAAAAAPRKCAFCEDKTETPIPGPRYVDAKERWFCDTDCLDLFARLDSTPTVSRFQPMAAGPVVPRYEGLSPEQRDKLEEIDAEDGGPPDPKPRRRPRMGEYGTT